MSSLLSKIRSVHTYVMPRTVYFGWICSFDMAIKNLFIWNMTSKFNNFLSFFPMEKCRLNILKYHYHPSSLDFQSPKEKHFSHNKEGFVLKIHSNNWFTCFVLSLFWLIRRTWQFLPRFVKSLHIIIGEKIFFDL